MRPDLKDYFPETQHNGLGWPHIQLMVSEQHRILYCPIAKNACSSLKRLMVSISNVEHGQRMIEGDIHGSLDFYRTGAKLGDLNFNYAKEIMASKDYFKFAVVRDPFARMVSAYLEKFVINRERPGNQLHTGPVISAIQGSTSADFRRGVSFADFVQFVVTQDPQQLDPHWKPQTLYLAEVTYDHIYRIDRLNVLRQDLEKRIGYRVNLEHRNRSHRGRPRYVPGSAYRLPDALTEPERIDKNSFMDSEIMFHIVSYFAEDYRLYYSSGPRIGEQIDSSSSGDTGNPILAKMTFLGAGLRRLFGVGGSS